MMDWDEPLTPEERETILNEVTEAVARRGLQTPALFALEMHRPFAFTLSQSLILSGPLLAPLLGIERMERAARLLREPGTVELLIERLERSAIPTDSQTAQAQDGKG